MKAKPLPLQKYLHSILDYNPENGVFVWKYRNDVSKQCNIMYATKVAGTEASNGYWTIYIDGRNYRAHRLAWIYIYGDVLSDELIEIDHKNRNKLQNNIDNLRLATKSKNGANSIGKSRKGFPKGVGKNKKRFSARIMVDHVRINLGTFDTPELAHAAYCESAKKHHGEFARAA